MFKLYCFQTRSSMMLCRSALLITLWTTFYLLDTTVSGQRADLINPIFSAVQINQINDTTMDLNLKTRAAEYKLTNFDWVNGTSGQLQRISNFVEPWTLHQTEFYLDYTVKRSYKEHRQEAAAANINSPLQFNNYRLFLCQASTIFTGESGEELLCYREHIFYRCPRQNNVPCMEPFQLASDLILTMDVVTDSSFEQPVIVLLSITGDFLARGIVKSTGENMWKFGNPKNLVNQNIPIGVSETELEGRANGSGWLQNNILKSKPELKQKLQTNLAQRLSHSYIKSIAELPDPSKGEMRLCYSRLNSISPRFLHCFDKTQFLSNTQTSDMTVTSFHQVEREGKKIIHIGYSYMDDSHQPNTYYYFCDQPIDSHKLDDLDGAATNTNTSCKPQTIVYPPNDITGIKQGKCDVTVGFFDLTYALVPATRSLSGPNVHLKELNGLNFYINAAMFHNNKMYFFVHANNLLQVGVSLSEDCSTMTVDWSDAVDMPGDRFIARYLNRDFRDAEYGPSLLDYRELIEGSEDTNPSLKTDSWTHNYGDRGSLDAGSIVPLLLLVLLMFAIVGAAIYYFVYFRQSDGPVLTTAPSSRADPPPESLIASTVRSGQISQLLQPGQPSSTTSPASTTTVRVRPAGHTNLSPKSPTRHVSPLAGVTKHKSNKSVKSHKSHKSPSPGLKSKSAKSTKTLGRPHSPKTKSGKSKKSKKSKSPASSKISSKTGSKVSKSPKA